MEIWDIIDSKRFIKPYTNKHELPSDTSDHISIKLSGMFHRNSGPVARHLNNHYTVAISDHADFNETLEYIDSVNPKMVLTDPSSGKDYANNLSTQIRNKLNIDSHIININRPGAWGT